MAEVFNLSSSLFIKWLGVFLTYWLHLSFLWKCKLQNFVFQKCYQFLNNGKRSRRNKIVLLWFYRLSAHCFDPNPIRIQHKMLYLTTMPLSRGDLLLYLSLSSIRFPPARSPSRGGSLYRGCICSAFFWCSQSRIMPGAQISVGWVFMFWYTYASMPCLLRRGRHISEHARCLCTCARVARVIPCGGSKQKNQPKYYCECSPRGAKQRRIFTRASGFWCLWCVFRMKVVGETGDEVVETIGDSGLALFWLSRWNTRLGGKNQSRFTNVNIDRLELESI